MLSSEKEKWLKGLTVVLLKDELKGRGLSTTGLKAELAARLREALTEEEEARAKAEEAAPAEDPQLAGSPDQQQAAPKSPGHKEEQEVKEQKRDNEPAAEEEADPAPAAPSAEQPEEKEALEQSQEQPEQEKEHSTKLEQHDQEEIDYGTEDEQHDEQEHTPAPQVGDAAGAKPTQHDETAHVQHKEGHTQAGEPVVSGEQEQIDKGAATAGAGDAARTSDDGNKKLKRAPILFQPKSRRSDSQSLEATAAAQDASEPTTAPSKPAAAPLVRQPSAAAPPPLARPASVALPEGPATQALLIENLVRPFTEVSLRQLIGQTGTVVDMWMPSIKTHAFVILETAEQGEATCAALHGVTWPLGSNKQLKVSYLTVEAAQEGIALGRDPSASHRAPLRVQRAGAAAPAPVQSPTDRAAAAMDVDAPSQAPDGNASSAEPQAAEGATEQVAAAKVGKMGIGAVAAAKAAAAAAAGANGSLKRARSGSQEPGQEPNAKRAHPTVGPEKVQLPQPNIEEAVMSLDTLFKKTAAKPHIYWLPLTDAQVTAKKARQEREEKEQQLQAAQGGDPGPGARLPLAQRYPHLSGLAPPRRR